MFNWLTKWLKGEGKRTESFRNKQREQAVSKPVEVIKSKKLICDGTPRGIAFVKRVMARRAKKLMCINTNRQRRGLFQYA